MKRVKGALFANLKLVHKLVALFMCMAVIVVVSGCYGIWSINRVSGNVETMLKTRSTQEKLAVLMKVDMQECRVDLLRAAMIRNDGDELELTRGDYEVARDRILTACDVLLNGNEKLKIVAAKKGGQLAERLNGVIDGMTAFDTVAGRLLSRKEKLIQEVQGGRIAADSAMGDAELNRMAMTDIHGASDKVMVKVDDLLVTVTDMMTQAGKEVQAIERRTKVAFASVIIGGVLLALSLGIFTTRFLTRRIGLIADALKRGAAGDLTAKVGMLSGDELGNLGVDFDTMTERLAAMVGKLKSAMGELAKISGNLSDTSTQVLNAAQRETEAVTDTSSAMIEINASVKEVAQGIDSLSLSNAESSSSIMEMAASIEEVAINSETLTSSVDEVSSSIVQMATSVKHIDNSVMGLTGLFTSTASSVMEMDSAIRQVEANASDAASISEEVRLDAERGKEAVVATIAGMREIKRSSGITYEVISTLSQKAGDIGTILSVIDEVAEQTNLLALNAAIIAAQAGERGKGFAVVADEIKELAERTSSSTREISQVIKGVQDETRRAVEAIAVAEKSIADGEVLSQRSGEALNKIVDRVNLATHQVEEIARATVEQAKGSQMIREAIEEVLEMVGQIAAATREQGMGGDLITAAAERMKGLTEHVRGSTREQSKVGNFISRSTENITEMIGQIKRACDEQGRVSEKIIVSVEDIQRANNVNLDATKVMNSAVMNLSRQAEIMQKELSVFKV